MIPVSPSSNYGTCPVCFNELPLEAGVLRAHLEDSGRHVCKGTRKPPCVPTEIEPGTTDIPALRRWAYQQTEPRSTVERRIKQAAQIVEFILNGAEEPEEAK